MRPALVVVPSPVLDDRLDNGEDRGGLPIDLTRQPHIHSPSADPLAHEERHITADDGCIGSCSSQFGQAEKYHFAGRYGCVCHYRLQMHAQSQSELVYSI